MKKTTKTIVFVIFWMVASCGLGYWVGTMVQTWLPMDRAFVLVLFFMMLLLVGHTLGQSVLDWIAGEEP